MRRIGIEITEVPKVILVHLLVAVLGLSLVIMPACSVANFVQEFDQYSNQIVPALNTVIAILQLFGVVSPLGIAAKVDADVKAAQALVVDFAGASVLAQPTVRAQILAAENALNADLNQVFSLARVSDKNAQIKVQALITLIESAIQIGFNLIPQNTSQAALKVAQQSAATTLSPPKFVASFNAILTAPTGNAKLDALTARSKLPAPCSGPLCFFGKVVHKASWGRL